MTTVIAQGPVDVTVSRECPECGSSDTEWHCMQTTNSGVVDGRLRMHDVSTTFYLGCNCCSETIRTVRGDDVAHWLNASANAEISGARRASAGLRGWNSEEPMQLVLIRGLPGSGKSTMARALHKAGFEWFEADTYHMNDEGDYCYDPANVKAAHEWCQHETFKALANGKRVVVSNTFTRRFEMEPYFEMAKTFGIEPLIIEATGNWPNVHGVPAEVVEKMRQRWEKSSNAELRGRPLADGPA